jgi:hypothetical protein
MSEVSSQLAPYANNTQCESCKKMFYANEKTQRGSARRFCSLRCRNAAYFERRAKDFKLSKTENQSLYLKIARLEKENEQLKADVEDANRQLAARDQPMPETAKRAPSGKPPKKSKTKVAVS